MKISKIKTVYFSPCGATKKVAEFVGNTLAAQLKVPNEIISYTLPAERKKILSYVDNKINRSDFNDKMAAYGAGVSGADKKNIFSSGTIPKLELSSDILLKTNNSGLDFLDKKMKEAQIKEAESLFKRDELVIWATPVYAGRIPNKTLDFVKDVLKGNGTPAIPVVVFGNRNFDNALAELTGIMKDNGLRPIAGAAVVARHAFDTADSGGTFIADGVSTVSGVSDINVIAADEKMLNCKTSPVLKSTGVNALMSDYETSLALKSTGVNALMSNCETSSAVKGSGISGQTLNYKASSAEGSSDINVNNAIEGQLHIEYNSNFKINEIGERPSESDFEEIKEFCTYVANCIKTNHELKFVITAPGDEHPAKYYTPLKEDGTPANFLKAKPEINEELCISCGICSGVCPMGSIAFEHEDMFDFSKVERYPQFTGICIKCQACIRNCPVGALYFDDEEFLSHVRMIKRDYSKPQENCFIC